MAINYCENSTIEEAWAAVMGVPGTVEPREAFAIEMVAKRHIPELEIRPVGLLVPRHAEALSQDPAEHMPPLWSYSVQWNGGSGLARFGHRVLSVHRTVQPGHKYERYDVSLRPDVQEWLGFLREAYAFMGVAPAASTAVFGYTNVFRNLPEDSDLSEYFHFGFDFDAKGADKGFARFDIGARVDEEEGRTYYKLVAERSDDNSLVVITNVTAERDIPEGVPLTDADALDNEILMTKGMAKEGFFSFATSKTKQLMGAREE